MLLFQILFIVIILLEIGVGLMIKYNCGGLRDKLVDWFHTNDIEEYVRHEFPNKWIGQMLFILIIFLLSII